MRLGTFLNATLFLENLNQRPCLACDFHHDGSLENLDPESTTFFDDLHQKEAACEAQELAVTGNCKIDLEQGTATGDKCSLPVEFEDFSQKTAMPATSAWGRFPFLPGQLPAPFSASPTALRSITKAFISQEQGEGVGARVYFGLMFI